MALTLNTNIDSLVAQNNLSGSQALLGQSLTRLSSGLRINSAADDAAGLAISDQFTTQINGTNQAINNANDAVSQAQTTAGALTTVVNNLQSIRTLAVEAANGANSASDRAALDQQVQQQISEITQIAQQTQFNGLNVLNGTAGSTVYQVGANVGDTITVNLGTGVEASQIGQYASTTGTAAGTAIAGNGDLTLAANGGQTVVVGASVAGTGNAGQTAGSAYAIAQSINEAGVQGLTATASTTAALGAYTALTSSATPYTLAINGVNIFGASGLTISGTNTLTQTQLEQDINAQSSATGVVASTDATTGNISLTAADGSNIKIADSTGFNSGFAATIVGTNYGTVSLTSSGSITVGGSNAAAIGLTAGSYSNTGSALSAQNVKTIAGANATIASVDAALATISQFQSQLGAVQNRFTSAVQNLTSTSQNLTQSRSTILDANFAQETANLTQAQVLEQAGISVLAQANQQPQLILKLLQ